MIREGNDIENQNQRSPVADDDGQWEDFSKFE